MEYCIKCGEPIDEPFQGVFSGSQMWNPKTGKHIGSVCCECSIFGPNSEQIKRHDEAENRRSKFKIIE